MAASSKPVGYECEFVDQVPEDYFCKRCSHVAREPNITSCCGEILCKACVESVVQDKKPCPNCQQTEISYIPHKKYQPKILALKVHCSLKDRGCEWTGQLQHLDAHLDLTTGDCVYVDVDCPSKCDQKVQKCNVATHLANHCPNRDYTCPHCSFKATFHEVSEHFEICRYYPLMCPNRCGASFERDVLEDHIKMCGQQELQCEFSYAGCGAEFIRDHQKEHMEQNTQKHLALVAAATLRISQTFEQKFQEQQRKFKQKLEDKDSEIKAIVNNEASQLVNEQRQQSEAQIRDLESKLQQSFELRLAEKDAQIRAHEKKITALEQRCESQQQMFEQKLQQQSADISQSHDAQTKMLEKIDALIKALEEQQKVFEKKLERQREEFHKQQRMFEEKEQKINSLVEHNELAINNLCLEVGIPPYEFTLTNYQSMKTINGSLLSPHMYVCPGGYKFELRVWVSSRKSHVELTISLLRNDRLELPSRLTITLELLNQHRDQDHVKKDIKWAVNRSNVGCHTNSSVRQLIPHSDLEWNAGKQTQYLKNDCLKFRISKIV